MIPNTTAVLAARPSVLFEEERHSLDYHSLPTTSTDRAGVDSTRQNRQRVVCLFLHAVLILIHFGLLAIWLLRAEHKVVFATRLQTTMALAVTAVTTALGMAYLSVLLFITQKLALRRNLQTDRTLTATHDNAMAWTGLGSALVTAFDQIVVPSSVLSTVSIAAYLFNISVLHVTTPALFSVQTFNMSIPTFMSTQGFPRMNVTIADDLFGLRTLAPILEPLTYLPWIGQTQTLGLANGSLYEVLDLDIGEGPVNVTAIGFNMSCAYLPGVSISRSNLTSSGWDGERLAWRTQFPQDQSPTPVVDSVFDTGPNMLRLTAASLWTDTVILVSTAKIVDSQGNTAAPVQLNPPMTNVSELYYLQCSKSVVSQISEVDSRTRKNTALFPDISKKESTWRPTSVPSVSVPMTADLAGPSWWSALLKEYVTGDGFQSNVRYNWDFLVFLTLADVYLMEQLGLYEDPADNLEPTLHDVENALSSLVASVLWIAGHMKSGVVLTKFEAMLLEQSHIPGSPRPPILTTGTAVVNAPTLASRLDLSIVAISAGLAASISLFLLSVPYLRQPRGARSPVEGTGILHIIWLFRSRPELAEIIPQVDDPINHNLRCAGMVKVAFNSGETGEKDNIAADNVKGAGYSENDL